MSSSSGIISIIISISCSSCSSSSSNVCTSRVMFGIATLVIAAVVADSIWNNSRTVPYNYHYDYDDCNDHNHDHDHDHD